MGASQPSTSALVSPEEPVAILCIRVNPKAKQVRIQKSEAEWVVALTAAPTSGKANQVLIKLLAQELKIPKLRFHIKLGHTSLHQLIKVDGEWPCP